MRSAYLTVAGRVGKLSLFFFQSPMPSPVASATTRKIVRATKLHFVNFLVETSTRSESSELWTFTASGGRLLYKTSESVPGSTCENLIRYNPKIIAIGLLQVPTGQYQVQGQHHQDQGCEALVLLKSRRLGAFPDEDSSLENPGIQEYQDSLSPFS